ncbi:MAG: Tfp pilus assembly protein FimT/FimU [Desulfovibrionaceae bacterium]
MNARRHVPPSAPPIPEPGADRAGRNGFTLIELITIIVILGILSVVIISAIDLTGPSALSETEALAAHLRYAQSRAMKSGDDWGIRCQGGAYWLFKGDDPTANITPLPGETGSTVTLSEKKVTVSTFTVVFDRFGVPRDTAGDRLDTDTTITVTATSGGTTRTIVITQETGYVS